MEFIDLLTVRDWIIIALVTTQLWCIIRVVHLRKLLAAEKCKRLIPILTVELDTNEGIFYLKNKGSCYAKDIRIKDVEITIAYEFKKKLLLKFQPVKELEPEEKINLEFRIFDKEYDITDKAKQSILAHMTSSPIDLHLTCANIENARFAEVIASEDKIFKIKEAKPL